MSEEQRQFAISKHNLIYTFLHEQNWPIEDYYDIAVFGFLKAVIRYLKEPQLQQYAFSTIAWRAMEQSIVSYQRAEIRRLRAEQQFCMETSYTQSLADDLDVNLMLQSLIPDSNSTQYQLAAMRLQGYSLADIEKQLHISSSQLSRMQSKLYKDYVQLSEV